MIQSDTVRDEAKQTVEKLDLSEVKCFIMTGDNEGSALDVASRVGIERRSASQLVSIEGPFIHSLAHIHHSGTCPTRFSPVKSWLKSRR